MARKPEGLISKLHRWRLAILAALVVAISAPLLGCYGTFPITTAVCKVNGDIENTYLRQVVFWLLIPVYGIGMVTDAVIINLVNFWFGKEGALASVTDDCGNTIVFEPSQDGREATLTVSRDGEVMRQVRFVRVSDTVCEARDTQGNLTGTVALTPDGGIEMRDAQGNVTATIQAGSVAELRVAGVK